MFRAEWAGKVAWQVGPGRFPWVGDIPPETERINTLGSGCSRWIIYQQGPHSSGEAVLPAGPEAEITFCCAEAAGAESRLCPAVSLHVPPCASGDSDGAWQASLG